MCVRLISFQQKGWKLFNLDTKEFFVSRNVKFFEEVFPFHSPDDVNIVLENNFDNHVEIHNDFGDYGDLVEETNVENNADLMGVGDDIPTDPPNSTLVTPLIEAQLSTQATRSFLLPPWQIKWLNRPILPLPHWIRTPTPPPYLIRQAHLLPQVHRPLLTHWVRPTISWVVGSVKSFRLF